VHESVGLIFARRRNDLMTIDLPCLGASDTSYLDMVRICRAFRHLTVTMLIELRVGCIATKEYRIVIQEGEGSCVSCTLCAQHT
jgi:hypothetical protein